CDLTKESEILSLFDEIRQKVGRLDVCINNAGLSHDAPLLTGATSQFRNMLDVSIKLNYLSLVSTSPRPVNRFGCRNGNRGGGMERRSVSTSLK
ncbi:hypothetical protein AVEN_262483-1, partial [Araneus ventricosus]